MVIKKRLIMDQADILIASDHAGLELKSLLISWLRDTMSQTVEDLGPHTSDSVDYPDFADTLADAMLSNPGKAGILICGSGIGISIAANRHRHIRAALVHDETGARLARLHNDANVIVLGARTIGQQVAIDCVSTFLDTSFE